MIRIITLILSAVLVFCSSCIALLASDSGWEQKQGYTYQRIDGKSLFSFGLSSGKDSIYTFHSDNILRIWDFQTGKVIDSANLDSTVKSHYIPQLGSGNIDKVIFSKDGKSMIITYTLPSPPASRIAQVYDINARNMIHSFLLNNTGSTQNSQANNYVYDYVYASKEVYIGFIDNYSSSDMFTSRYGTSGSFSKIVLKDSSSGAATTIYSQPLRDYMEYENNDLIFSTGSAQSSSVYKRGQMGYYTEYSGSSTVGLRKLNTSTGAVTTLSTLTISKDAASFPDNMRALKLYPTSMKDTILYSGYDSIYYFSLATNSVIKNLSIPFHNKINADHVEKVYEKKDVVVSYQDTLFYFNKIKTSGLIDSVVSPIAVTSFYIIGDKYILSYNTKGEMAVMSIDTITSAKPDKKVQSVPKIITSQPEENISYPNPTNKEVILQQSYFQAGHLRIELVDMMGKIEKVLYDGIYEKDDLRFDVSDTAKGIYLLHAIQKDSVKTFKIMIVE